MALKVAAISCKLTYSGPGSPGYNIWHMRYDDAEAIDYVDAARDALHTFYTSAAGFYPIGTTIEVATAVTIVNSDPAYMVPAQRTTVLGTASSGELPERLAILAQLQGDALGRSGRGRKFLGPMSKACCEANGTVDESVRSQWVTFLTTLKNAPVALADWSWCVWSQKNQEPYDWFSVSVDNEFAELKTRRF